MNLPLSPRPLHCLHVHFIVGLHVRFIVFTSASLSSRPLHCLHVRFHSLHVRFTVFTSVFIVFVLRSVPGPSQMSARLSLLRRRRASDRVSVLHSRVPACAPASCGGHVRCERLPAGGQERLAGALAATTRFDRWVQGRVLMSGVRCAWVLGLMIENGIDLAYASAC